MSDPTGENPTLNTRDLGLAIRDFLEGKPVHHFEDDVESAGYHEADYVDASDPNNLVVHMDNGQAFTIRVIAGAGR